MNHNFSLPGATVALRPGPQSPFTSDLATGIGGAGGLSAMSARPSAAPLCCCCDSGDCCDCCLTNTFLAPCLRAWVDATTGSGASAARHEMRHGVLLPLDAATAGANSAAARERVALFRARHAQAVVTRALSPYRALLAAARARGAHAALAAPAAPPVSLTVAVRGADALEPRRGLRFPAVRVHVVDLRTGAYLAPSALFPADLASYGAQFQQQEQQDGGMLQQRVHVTAGGAALPWVPAQWTEAVDLRTMAGQDYSRGRGRAGAAATAARLAQSRGGEAAGDVFSDMLRKGSNNYNNGDGNGAAANDSDSDDDCGDNDGGDSDDDGNSPEGSLLRSRKGTSSSSSGSKNGDGANVLVQRGSYEPRWTGTGSVLQFPDLLLSDLLTPSALLLFELLDLGGPLSPALLAHPESDPAVSRPDARIAWAFTVLQKAPVRGSGPMGSGTSADGTAPAAAWPGASMFNTGPARLQLYRYTHAPGAFAAAHRPATPLVYYEWVWQKNTARVPYPSTLYTVIGGLPPPALVRDLTLGTALGPASGFAAAAGGWAIPPEVAKQLQPHDVAVLAALAAGARADAQARQLEARRLALLERLLAVYSRAVHATGLARPGRGGASPALVRPPRLDARLTELLCGPQGCSALAFSPSGLILAGACGETFNFCIKLWEYAPMQELAPGAAGHAAARALALGALGPLARSWRLLQTLRGHNALIHDVAWSPDGRELVSASADGTAMVWAVDSEALHGASLRAVDELRRSGGGLTAAALESSSASTKTTPLVVPAPDPAELAVQMAARAKLSARSTPVLVLQHLTFVYAAKFYAPKTELRDAYGAPLPAELAPPPLLLTGAFDGRVRVWSRDGALLAVLSDAPMPAASATGGANTGALSARGSLHAASVSAEAELMRQGLRPGSGRVTNTAAAASLSYTAALSAASRAVLSPEVSQGMYLSTVADSVDQVAALLAPSSAALVPSSAAPGGTARGATGMSGAADAALFAQSPESLPPGAARINALLVAPGGGKFYTADALGRVRLWEDLHAFAPVLLHTADFAGAGISPDAVAAASVVGSAVALAQAQDLDLPSPDLAEVAGTFGGGHAFAPTTAGRHLFSGGARVNGLTALEWRSRFRVFRTMSASTESAGGGVGIAPAAVSSLALVPRPLPEAVLALSHSNAVYSLPLTQITEPPRVLANAAGFTARSQHLALALSPCGSTLIAGSEDGRAYVFDIAPEAADALAADPPRPAPPAARSSPGRLSYVVEAGFPLPLRAVAWSSALHVAALGAFGGNYPVVIMGPSRSAATLAAAAKEDMQQQNQQQHGPVAGASGALPPLRGDYGSGLTRSAAPEQSAASSTALVQWESPGLAAAREAAMARVAARMRARYGIDLHDTSAPIVPVSARSALQAQGQEQGLRQPEVEHASRGLELLPPPATASVAPAKTDGPLGTHITPPKPAPGGGHSSSLSARGSGGAANGFTPPSTNSNAHSDNNSAASASASASAAAATTAAPGSAGSRSGAGSRLNAGSGSASVSRLTADGPGSGVGATGARPLSGSGAGAGSAGARPGAGLDASRPRTATTPAPASTMGGAGAGEPMTPVQRRLEQEMSEHSGGSLPGTPEGPNDNTEPGLF